eukprot:2702944-Pleurochrysis_carterae.AAC.1
MEELKAEQQRLRDEITELKGITEAGKKYFHHAGFTLAVDLAIAEAITMAHFLETRCRPSSSSLRAAFASSCRPTLARYRTRLLTAR